MKIKLIRVAVLLLLTVTASCYSPPRVVVVNGLEDKNIKIVHVSDTSEPNWGTNSLNPWELLAPGDSIEITVVAGTYDLQATDEAGKTYTRWNTRVGEDESYHWLVTASDADEP